MPHPAGRRKKKVDSALLEALSRIVIEELREVVPDLITVTRVETTADLRTAHVFLSLLGSSDPALALEHLRQRTGWLRRRLAALVKLKYNPTLIFELDPAPEFAQRLEALIDHAKRHDRDTD